MRIKDFKLTGKYPNISVEAVLEEDQGTTNVSLGDFGYVSVLTSSELKSLVSEVYKASKKVARTKAMESLVGQSLDHASTEEMP